MTIKRFSLVIMMVMISFTILVNARYSPYSMLEYLKFQVIDEQNREAALTGYYEALGVAENFWGWQIPDTINVPSVVTIAGKEYTVTEIADNALSGLGHFANQQRYEDFWPSIVLPETIRRLGKRSLWTNGEYGYTRVNLPHSLEEMADSCLLTCTYGGQYTMLENVNSIGKNVFQGPGVGVLTFMNHDFELNANMFTLSYIQVLTFCGENLSIAAATFNGTSEIERLVFGFYPCSIASNAFGENTAINKIVVYCPEPYSIPENAFTTSIYQNAKLLVPENALENYRNAPGWKNFASIESICSGDVNYDGAITASDITAQYNYMLNGNTENFTGGDVNGDGNITAADVTEIYSILLNNEPPTPSIEILDVDSIQTYTVNGVSFNMVGVKGGTFMMGSEEWGNSRPVHQVTLSSYYIGQTEVTQELWEAVMGNNPSRFNGGYWSNGYNRPVENVSLFDCIEFVQRLNTLTGENFKVPTDAEWEYAAGGGKKSHGYIYSGSNNIDDVAWHRGNFDEEPPYAGAPIPTKPVATKMPNELGIYDMSGNVEEWVSDRFQDYTAEPQVNPTGPETGLERITRGGDIGSNGVSTDRFKVRFRGRIGRIVNEQHVDAGLITEDYLGFRLAKDVSTQE